MSCRIVTGSKPENVFKSRIPMPTTNTKSKIPVPVTSNALSKNRSKAVSLETKPSSVSTKAIKQPVVFKDKDSIQKLSEKHSTQFIRSKNPQNGTARGSKLACNQIALEPLSKIKKLNSQRKIAKEVSNPLTVSKENNIRIQTVSNKNNLNPRTANATSNIAKSNKNVCLSSNLNKCGLKRNVAKELPRLPTKENKDFTKKSKPNEINTQKVSQTVVGKVNLKERNNFGKRPVLKNEKQMATSVEIESKLKENKLPDKQNVFASQKDIKFEASEFFRNQILSGRELSPGILKQQPGLKLSFTNVHRSSVYDQEMVIPSDPYKETLRAIENLRLSVKKDRPSVIKENNKVPLSPFKDHRNSIYTPCSNPMSEALKSLEALKLRQLQRKASKSAKKVSFNLNVQECTPKDRLDVELTPYRITESRLTQINEKSEENTPNSPENKVNDSSLIKQEQDNLTTQESSKSEHIFLEPKAYPENSQETDTVQKSNSDSDEFPKFCTPVTKSVPFSLDLCNSLAAHSATGTEEINAAAMIYNINKYEPKCLSPFCDSKNDMNGTSINELRRMSFQSSSLNYKTQLNANFDKANVCTPRPISLFAKSSLIDVSSPEFLADTGKNRFLSDCAPIQTPLFLRSLAKCAAQSPVLDLSPVRMKLDFTEDKDSPKIEASSRRLSVLISENITTNQKILDDLADQECYLHLRKESMSVLCGRYLQNPIALTLTDGDDMHFLPIQY